MEQLVPAAQTSFTFTELNPEGNNNLSSRSFDIVLTNTHPQISAPSEELSLLLKVGYFKYLLFTAMLFIIILIFLQMSGITEELLFQDFCCSLFEKAQISSTQTG